MYALVLRVLNFLLVVDRKDPVTKSRFLEKKATTRRFDWHCSCEIMLNAESLKRPSLGLSGISKSLCTKCHRMINYNTVVL